MKSLANTSRANTALEVVQHMSNGMTVVEACQLVGIPRSSFYSFIKNNPEVVAEIQDIVEANRREQLGMILFCETEMLRKIIEAGLAEETTPKDRLTIFMKLSELEKTLTQSTKLNENELRAQAFLSEPPKLVPGTSRFSSIE